MFLPYPLQKFGIVLCLKKCCFLFFFYVFFLVNHLFCDSQYYIQQITAMSPRHSYYVAGNTPNKSGALLRNNSVFCSCQLYPQNRSFHSGVSPIIGALLGDPAMLLLSSLDIVPDCEHPECGHSMLGYPQSVTVAPMLSEH